ncbi:hypothetical protein TBLA_0E02355 [Henningerozyma blattae CBS 6284]|uniref:Uncharacterized protein n=1 Tax=Henningerozyma blattae (strain ATCC 34711 / CBS 6284 / DSM 70876 / NBRC 10599 / NRRL Y-10934 / UCD 77-7) TaxID=1071380 RepID=I2H4I8_HENB6|nr:hypothetical protein TBLA_0E02355 [Tetrapisispora blattae CBS 6284]CCH61290.1 hypothetical protein TBLA_0E02355 [Tetrapisispora blattae CBS 6284]
MYVPAKAYSTWVQTELNKDYISLYNIVECTLSKGIQTDHEIYENILDALYNISFDGNTDASIFRSTTLGLRNKARELDISISDDWISRRILKSLKGNYAGINADYLKISGSYDLEELLFTIQKKSSEIAGLSKNF